MRTTLVVLTAVGLAMVGFAFFTEPAQAACIVGTQPYCIIREYCVMPCCQPEYCCYPRDCAPP